MGCVASRIGEEEEEAVAICRERKKLMKLAVEKRYELADAHCRYCHSLYAVAAAIKLFVARHSTPSSPFLITFPPPNCSPSSLNSPSQAEKVTTNPILLQQNPSQPTITSHEDENLHCCEQEKESKRNFNDTQQQQTYGYYSLSLPMSMPTPQTDFDGWDFFNPFYGVRPESICPGYGSFGGEDLKAVREEEGLPELEKEEEREVQKSISNVMEDNNGNNVKVMDEKGLNVIDKPVRGKELLDALKDIEDHFIRAYDSGKEVSRMLEANKMHMQSGLDEIKENSTKLIQAITWHRSNTARSSSCKSLVASSSKNSSSWAEYKNDLFDDYGGMSAGSHSLTLGRLYAWEKKLYEEVKAGDDIKKLYKRKCSQLRNKDVKGGNTLSVDKIRASVKDLYSRILVALRRAESISEQIEKLADEELQPQIIELLQGLTRSWQTMMASHESQSHIIFEVSTFDCPSYGKFCNDSHRLATLQLEAEIQNWRERFVEYVAAQKSYVGVLHGWLSKFIVPEVEFWSKLKSYDAPYRAKGPPLYTICRDWLSSMENLPDKAVSMAMKTLAKDIRALWVQQGEEQNQKRKVDKMVKGLEKKMVAYQKVEGRIQDTTKLLEYKHPLEMDAPSQDDDTQQHEPDYLSEKKDTLDGFKRRLEFEKEKHHHCMEESRRITLNGFQTGFSLIFDAMVHFSTASLKMYNDLVSDHQSLKGES
ncbi:protein ROLLING AND ERECT LEAF 2-like [Amaranthus tricolor]|uniref:protein ROLLING AND ERECT LEAF 2-like n=1 Tax=Amaranthus tricolor TaxID=29722 RepID=UPI00258D9625|nr:protein ROLLING AND ERECT LEAF 2-like [Amaranthus tricolor]